MLILHCCSLKRRWAGQGLQTSRLQPRDCGCRPQAQPCHPRGRHLPFRHPGMRTGAPSSGAVTASPQTRAHQYVAAVCALLLTFAVVFAGGVCWRHLLLAFAVGSWWVYCFWRSALDICCGVCCWHLMLGFAVSAECAFCFWHSTVNFCCGVASHKT